MPKLFSEKLVDSWQPIAAYSAGFSAIVGLFIFKLGSLTPGLSPSENAIKLSSSSVDAIWFNLVNAPYKLLEFAVIKIDASSILGLRLISVIFAIICVFLLYYLLKTWYSLSIVILTSVLFVTSAWFLHISRQATPEILLPLGVLIVLSFGTWFAKTTRPNLALVIGALLTSFLLYLPGFVIIVAIGGIWQRKTLTSLLSQTKLYTKLLLPVILMVGFSPLVWMFAHNPETLKTYVGLPVSHGIVLVDTALNLLRVPIRIYARGPLDWTLWLGQTALVGIFTAIMSAVGFYSYYQRRKLDISKALGGFLLIGSVLVALDGLVNFALLMPIIFFAAACGISFFLDQWLEVFPRNPVAKKTGIVIVAALVILTSLYNLDSYFTAWPNAPETKNAFSAQQQ